MDEKIDYVLQFINIRRFRFTEYEIDKLVAFVDGRNELNGRRKMSKGIELKASTRDGRYDVREDREFTYVFDASGIYLVKHRFVYHDGLLAYDDTEEIRNPRELLKYVDWFLR